MADAGDERVTTSVNVLQKVDLSLALDRETYEKEMRRWQVTLRNLEFGCFEQRVPVVIVYEGWDASGKGGNIRRLSAALDPRGYDVIAIAAPTGDEKVHHYLWRFWRQIPKAGHIAVFDRSWYGRAMVERVEGFCTEAEWRRAYREIREFEHDLVDFGTVIVKFWMHVDKDEQLRRFKERETVPHKGWKITDEDWRNREKWDEYEVAVVEMLQRTSTPYAPWTIVEGNCKLYARVKTLKTVCNAIRNRLGK